MKFKFEWLFFNIEFDIDWRALTAISVAIAVSQLFLF